MRYALLAVALISCDQLFKLDRIPELQPGDGALGSAAPCFLEGFGGPLTAWNIAASTDGPQISPSQGTLVISSPQAGSIGFSAIVTKATFDLTSSQVAVEVVQAPGQAAVEARLYIATFDGSSNRYQVTIKQNQIEASEFVQGTESVAALVATPSPVFWIRVGHVAITHEVTIETATNDPPDPWLPLVTLPDAVPVTSVNVGLSAGSTSSSQSWQAVFDNVSVTGCTR
jgi:hypothetical protein